MKTSGKWLDPAAISGAGDRADVDDVLRMTREETDAVVREITYMRGGKPLLTLIRGGKS